MLRSLAAATSGSSSSRQQQQQCDSRRTIQPILVMCVTFRYVLIGLSMMNYFKLRTAKKHFFHPTKYKIAPLTVKAYQVLLSVCHIPCRGARQFLFFSSFFNRFLSFRARLCRAYCIHYDDLALYCLLCLEQPCHLRAPTWTPPPSITCRREPSFFFLFSSFIIVLCACVYPEDGPAGEPGAIAGVSGRWRVEGGLDEARSPFWWLGVACPSRHEGSIKRFCLASWTGGWI